ncbi:MAG TPA: hypothetical protein VJH67_02900 [Candidatus Paceibacterota bacterium]
MTKGKAFKVVDLKNYGIIVQKERLHILEKGIGRMEQVPRVEKTKDGLLVIRLHEVLVDRSLSFEEAVRLGAPGTGENSFVFLCEGQYSRMNQSEIREASFSDISLLSFRRRWKNSEGIEHLESIGHKGASPQEVLAIGGNFPRLNQSMSNYAPPSMYVTSVRGCFIGIRRCFFCLAFGAEQPIAGLTSSYAGWHRADEWLAVIGNVE